MSSDNMQVFLQKQLFFIVYCVKFLIIRSSLLLNSLSQNTYSVTTVSSTERALWRSTQHLVAFTHITDGNRVVTCQVK